MSTVPMVLMAIHLLGLSLGVGSATVKLVLLFKSKANTEFLPVYFMVAKSITRLIIMGMILLTLSGIGFLFVGYSFTTLFIIKLVLVGLMWVIGPVIDNVVEPKFEKLIPSHGETRTPEFVRIRKKYLILEITATGLMYAITIIGAML